jgi:hypothetical protein
MSDPKIKPGGQNTLNEQAKLDVGFLPVGVTQRQSLGIYKAPDKVRSVTDLPVRLYLGSLAENTFHKSDEGWDVRYEDADPNTFVSLEYRQARNLLVARFTWNGIDGISVYCSGKDWKGLAQQMSIGFPKSWDETAKQNIEAGFNAQYFIQPNESPTISGFPDGVWRTLVFPLPSYRLLELISLLDAIDSDTATAAVVSVSAVMTPNRIDYIQGRCEDIPDTPEALASQSRKTTGLPCYRLPEVATVDDSLEILTLNRWIYLVHVGCAFRDLMRVMSHCQGLGLISIPHINCTPSDYPDGMEWAALVLPGGFECMDIRPQYFDRARSRRIAYGRLLSPEHLSEITTVRDISRMKAHNQLMVAAAWALSQPDVGSPEPNTLVH